MVHNAHSHWIHVLAPQLEVADTISFGHVLVVRRVCGSAVKKKKKKAMDPWMFAVSYAALAAQHIAAARRGRPRRPRPRGGRSLAGRPIRPQVPHDWAWGSAASSGAEWPARPLAQQASMMLGARPRSRSQQQATGIHKASHPRLLRCGGRGGRGPTTY
eukprot:COSAG01_NODE_1504_length_10094_cov_24.449925_4_plen_159_part_00